MISLNLKWYERVFYLALALALVLALGAGILIPKEVRAAAPLANLLDSG